MSLKMAALCLDATVNSNHSHMVFLGTPLLVDFVTDSSKLPWHKYLKRQQSKATILTTIPPHCLRL